MTPDSLYNAANLTEAIQLVNRDIEWEQIEKTKPSGFSWMFLQVQFEFYLIHFNVLHTASILILVHLKFRKINDRKMFNNVIINKWTLKYMYMHDHDFYSVGLVWKVLKYVWNEFVLQ